MSATPARGQAPAHNVREAWHGLRGRLSDGDLGPTPILVGLGLIWGVFYLLNPRFLAAGNLVNLALQSAAVGVIALGVVLVLLLGQIDLSVGSISGLSAAVLGVTFAQQEWPLAVAIFAALTVGALIGAVYGFLITTFGVPSFVITLAGLLAILGLQLWILGPAGSINLPFDSLPVRFAQQMFVPEAASYVLVAAAAIVYFWSRARTVRRREAAGLSAVSLSQITVRAVLLAVVLMAATWYLNTSRGIGVMFVLFLALVVAVHYLLSRTAWGRSIYAVGGNVEAARRAGIRVKRVYITVFMAATTLAALGGLLATARLASASQASGGGDTNLTAIAAAVIGGTSLFGGRGNAWSALLGIVVIVSISSGLTLLSLDSSVRYMVTGSVLLLAVIIDSLSRRSRASHGRA